MSMIVNYKTTSPFRVNNLIKFDKIISTSLTNESEYYYQIIDLISSFCDFFPQDDQINKGNIYPISKCNNQQFISNFSDLLIEYLKSLINNNSYQIADQSYSIELASSCLSNLNLWQNCFNEFDFNPFLRIISLSYFNQHLREMALEYFPPSYIIRELSSNIKSDIQKYGQNYLGCFYNYCSYEHSIDKSRIIFDEINSVKNVLADKDSVLLICYIICKMINFNTIPIDLFKKYNFQEYLTNLVKSKDLDIVQNALRLIGSTSNNIDISYNNLLDYFYFDLLPKNIENDEICVLIFWIMSESLDEDISNALTESDEFDKIVGLYPECSIYLKTELSLFISDILCLTTNFDFKQYIDDNTLWLIVDALNTGNQEIVTRFIKILYFIIYTIVERNNDTEYLYSMLNFLIDNGIFELLDRFIEDESDYDNKIINTIHHLNRMINCLIQQDECTI